jgi:mRNA interferase RelE/StbE
VASYKLLIKPSACKELEVVPKKERARLVERLRGLASDPRPPGSEKISGDAKHRVRQGVYRVVYAVDDTTRVVVVVKIGQRKDVYR